jgi:HlyD family secretion protein
LKVSETRIQYENARTEAVEAIRTGKLGVESAKQEIEAARLSMQAVMAGNPTGALKTQMELLEIRAEASRLLSPFDGEVLTVDAIVGQATSGGALMHLANTQSMICEAEVNVGDLPRVKADQTATITSVGLSEPVTGVVQRIEPMVSSPSLANPFPMAPVDRYAAKVIILIDQDDAARAAGLIQMQVEVTIDTGS